MNPLVQWWRDVATGPQPQRPLLVMLQHDDPAAVSALPSGYGAAWVPQDTATGRVAAYLDVPIRLLGEDLPEHDLLLVGEVGRGLTTMAARLAVGMFSAEPQTVVGHGSGISDVQWMDKVRQVRDTALTEPPACLAALATVIADSHVPVLLDGVCSAAAAALAPTLPSVQAPTAGGEPAQRFFLDRVDVPVWGLTGLGPGEGLGSLAGLAALRLALLAEG